MTIEIKGTYSIIAAAENKYRSNVIFSGTKEQYDSMKLRCQFRASSKNVLIVNELLPKYFNDVWDFDRIVILDSLEDMDNVGSLIRSASVWNYAVILRNCPMNAKVIEIACGGVEKVPILILNNASNQLKNLQEEYMIYGLSDKGHAIHSVRMESKHIIVVGSEFKGISPLVNKYCHTFISLGGGVLNASVAGAVAMFAGSAIVN